MAKKYKYQVIATKAVVDDMARYEDATAERGEFVRLGSIRPITDETAAKARCQDDEECDSHLCYHWTLTSAYPPTSRWASFGVKVGEVQLEREEQAYQGLPPLGGPCRRQLAKER